MREEHVHRRTWTGLLLATQGLLLLCSPPTILCEPDNYDLYTARRERDRAWQTARSETAKTIRKEKDQGMGSAQAGHSGLHDATHVQSARHNSPGSENRDTVRENRADAVRDNRADARADATHRHREDGQLEVTDLCPRIPSLRTGCLYLE
jgi:hypothetical protein